MSRGDREAALLRRAFLLSQVDDPQTVAAAPPPSVGPVLRAL
jgi:hypothetical protein